ncbi:MAG: hypothetical protein GY719_27085 [bacterium]|nr:hypothetical protein [bacterium]
MPRAPVGWGDLVRADLALLPGERGRAEVARMLGLSLLDVARLRKPPRPPPDDEPDDAPPGDGKSTRAVFDEDDAGPDVERLELTREPTQSLPPGDPLPPRQPSHLQPGLPFKALLTDRTEAELTLAAVSTPSPTSEVDVEAAVRVLARARPLVEVPRLLAPRIGPGTQVLVDLGEPMQPFRRDQEKLVPRLRRLAGRAVEVLYFRDDPAEDAGPTRYRRSWRRYAPPAAGLSVIALSDLGCGVPVRPRAVHAWRSLALHLRGRGSRIVAFAPIQPLALDARLRHAVSLITWDRGTNRVAATLLRQAEYLREPA